MTLVFASHNEHKVRELNQILPSPFSIKSLHQMGIEEEIEETGATIEANSLLKAAAVFNQLKIPTIADDSGLEVHALAGEPGVKSARYAGEEKDDEANISKLLDALDGVEERNAQFKTIVTLKTPSEEIQFKGIVRGHITLARRGEQGFGYDSVFIPDGEDRTFAEMLAEEKNDISHRSIAIKKLLTHLSASV